ncbi:hypothetical protein MRX96_005054 [Rhipicephalus microplus]
MESGTSHEHRVASPDSTSDYTCETFIAGPGPAIRSDSRRNDEPFDICPITVTKLVVAAYCQACEFDFVLISAYAPPHRSMDPTLQAIEETLLKVITPNVVVAGDFNAKHLVWGPNASDERGARLLEFAAANELIVLNDPQSRPTNQTPYAAIWIDVTLASSTAAQSGFQWEVREALTHLEHRYIEIRIRGSEVRTGKRLTRFAQAELLRALARDAWFDQVLGANISSAIALDFVMEAFYKIFHGHQHKQPRPVKSRAGKSWWTLQLAEERKRVNATRRRFQRCRDNDLRVWYRYEYSKALVMFRARIREARVQYEADCNAACSRRVVFSTPILYR